MHTGLDFKLKAEPLITRPTHVSKMFPDYVNHNIEEHNLLESLPEFYMPPIHSTEDFQFHQNPILPVSDPIIPPNFDGIGLWDLVGQEPKTEDPASGLVDSMVNQGGGGLPLLVPSFSSYPYYGGHQVMAGFQTEEESINNFQMNQVVAENQMAIAAAEKKRKRKIKNRESAARSRARQQAYDVQLLLEVQQLRAKNEELKKEKLELKAQVNMKCAKAEGGLRRSFSVSL